MMHGQTQINFNSLIYKNTIILICRHTLKYCGYR